MLASRLPLATGWGLLLSLATFWFLWQAINTPLVVGSSVIVKPPEFTPKIPDTTPEPIRPLREKPTLNPRETIGPPGPPVVVPPDPPTRTKPGPATRIQIGLPAGPGIPASGMDGDPMPIVRIEPTYPPAAERRGIEGWVTVQFSVTATGQVTDVVVVDADPAGVFDEYAIEAVGRWRYRPRVEGGIPVERVGLQTRIRFELP